MKIEEFNEWIQTYKNDDDGKFTAYVSTRDLHQLCKDYHKQQLALCSVSQQRELLMDLVEQIKLASYAVPMTEEKYDELTEKIKSINCW